MGNHLKNFKSLKGMIIIYFSFYIFIFMAIFGLAGYRLFSSIFMKNILTYTQQIIDEARRNIDSYISQIDLILTSTASNHTVIKYAELTGSDNNKYLSDRWIIEEYLQNSIKYNPKIRDIMLISINGIILSTSGKGVAPEYNFIHQKWFPGFWRDGKTFYSAMHRQDYYYENYGGTNQTVSAVVPVYSPFDKYGEIKAYIMCNINRFDLFETLKDVKLENNSTFILLDKENNIIVNTSGKKYSDINPSILNSSITENSSPFYVKIKNDTTALIYTVSNITGWKLIALVPERELLYHIKQLKYVFLFIFIFIMLIILISYNFLNNIITKPIRNITLMMNRIEQGDFSVKINETTTNDTEYLSKKINSLVENIVSLNKKVFTIELKNKEAQIKALQSQINPHFLFNTLQSIKAASVSADRKQTGRMITHLGNMLRYGIYDQDELVTIEDEIAHLEDYLKIQNYRFPGLFTCKIDCDENLKQKKTIKLLLQPLVENALTHNKLIKASIEINISITKQMRNILIKVSDTGDGIIRDKLESLREYIEDINLEEKSESIGIKNIHNRVYLRFGTPYGISLESVYKQGFTVKIIIPDTDWINGGENETTDL